MISENACNNLTLSPLILSNIRIINGTKKKYLDTKEPASNQACIPIKHNAAPISEKYKPTFAGLLILKFPDVINKNVKSVHISMPTCIIPFVDFI